VGGHRGYSGHWERRDDSAGGWRHHQDSDHSWGRIEHGEVKTPGDPSQLGLVRRRRSRSRSRSSGSPSKPSDRPLPSELDGFSDIEIASEKGGDQVVVLL
jgi:hypothetical protein